MQLYKMPMCFMKLANYGDRYRAKDPYLEKYVPEVDEWKALTEENVSTKTKICRKLAGLRTFVTKKVLLPNLYQPQERKNIGGGLTHMHLNGDMR